VHRRRRPSIVLRQKLDNEIRKGADILIDAEKRFLLVSSAQMAESGAGRVDEHQVAGIEQSEFIVDEAIRRRRAMGIIGGYHPLRTEGAHVQPDGR
jgi:hypothetical protein